MADLKQSEKLVVALYGNDQPLIVTDDAHIAALVA